MFLIQLFFLFILFTNSVLATPDIDNSTAMTANFSAASVSLVGQTITAVIGDSDHGNTTGIRVGDSGSAGWSATMTATNLTTMGVAKTLAGTNDTVGFTGVYTGVGALTTTSGRYTVEITTGGAVGAAKFKWTDPVGVETTEVDTATSVSLSNGVTVTFAPATYVVGDKWSVAVDAFLYTELIVSPSAIYAESGSLTGVTAGSQEMLTGSGITSNAKTIMTATAGNGIGTYWQDLDLNLNVHANPLMGSFSGVVVLTVS